MASLSVNHHSAISVASQHQPAASTSHSVYEIITARIVAELKRGVVPWRRPWSAKLPVNLISQKEYRGLNVLTLGSQGYPSRFWLTLNQANKLGGRIRRGEHSSPVIYWSIGEEREYTTREGETRVSKPMLLRYSTSSISRRRRGLTFRELLSRRRAPTTRSRNASGSSRGCLASPRSSSPTKHGTRRHATSSGCPPSASSAPARSFTPRSSTSSHTPQATRAASGARDSSPSSPSALSRTARRSSWRRSAPRCSAG